MVEHTEENIEAILFDVGGTLRDSRRADPFSHSEKIEKIMTLVGTEKSVSEFTQMLLERFDDYSNWARETYIELSNQDLWTERILPEWPPEKIRPMAVELNQLWRSAVGVRVFYPEVWAVLGELFRRGYRLGVVSNTISSVEVPQAIEEKELTGCFETVILSCDVGIRKPDPAIFFEATDRMGIAPENCAYLGNLIERDVIPAREAGFSKVGLRIDPEDLPSRRTENEPDFYFKTLDDLLEMFPSRQMEEAAPQYAVSLSTMWGIHTTPQLTDFFEAARRMGFSAIELNHKVDSAMLEGIDFEQFNFSSVHEPCPADISTSELTNRDWLVSSPVEGTRIQGVNAIKRSLDLAHQLGSHTLVVHCGTIQSVKHYEDSMRDLFQAGKQGTEEYNLLREEFIVNRRKIAAPHLEAVKKSLLELMEYAETFNIQLGIENRYHYYDIPNLEEMEELLALGSEEQLGFLYDVGHAETLDQLGFYPHEKWLRKYATRIVGMHIHDVNGIIDHYAPGLGHVDYEMIAPYLPEDAYRAFEVRGWNSYQDVKAALDFLEKIDFIQTKGV